MSFNLLDVAKELVTKELVTKASDFLGESETGVAKAFSGILPALINGITEKASSNEGASTIANLAYAAHNSGYLNNIGDFFKTDNVSGSLLNKGAGILSGLFGDSKVGALTNLISNFSGIKPASAGSLLSMAAPMLLGLLGKHASTDNVNSMGLASLLTSQKRDILKALPDGLNLGNVFSGLSNDIKYVPNRIASTAKKETTEIKEGGSLKWLLPLLLLALVAAAFWYLLGKGCNDGPAISDTLDSLQSKAEQVAADIKDGTQSVAGKLDSLTGDWIYAAGREVTIDLPNNAGKLVVGENSTENKLYKFLASNDPLDTIKGSWFELTNVRFKTGGTQLDSGSMVQLQNMVAITKAFPKAVFKLGGYTDNTGDSAANVMLSQKRADAVVSQLQKLGISATSISGAKGYGPQWPIADNATAEGRAQNRRVAVNVKAK